MERIFHEKQHDEKCRNGWNLIQNKDNLCEKVHNPEKHKEEIYEKVCLTYKAVGKGSKDIQKCEDEHNLVSC